MNDLVTKFAERFFDTKLFFVLCVLVAVTWLRVQPPGAGLNEALFASIVSGMVYAYILGVPLALVAEGFKLAKDAQATQAKTRHAEATYLAERIRSNAQAPEITRGGVLTAMFDGMSLAEAQQARDDYIAKRGAA